MRSVGRVYPSEDSAYWGSIVGDINDQADLLELVAKTNSNVDKKLDKLETKFEDATSIIENDISVEQKRALTAEAELLEKIEAAGASVWGQISGDIKDQKDLIKLLKTLHGLSVKKVDGECYSNLKTPLEFETEDLDPNNPETIRVVKHYIGRICDTLSHVSGHSHPDFVEQWLVDNINNDLYTESEKQMYNKLLEVHQEADTLRRSKCHVLEKYFPERFKYTALCVEYNKDMEE